MNGLNKGVLRKVIKMMCQTPEMMQYATNSAKLSEITEQKEAAEAALEEKMERWVYLNDLAERIENQKSLALL